MAECICQTGFTGPTCNLRKLSLSIDDRFECIVQVIPVRHRHVRTEVVVLHCWQIQVLIGQHIVVFVHQVSMDNIVIQVRDSIENAW